MGNAPGQGVSSPWWPDQQESGRVEESKEVMVRQIRPKGYSRFPEASYLKGYDRLRNAYLLQKNSDKEKAFSRKLDFWDEQTPLRVPMGGGTTGTGVAQRKSRNVFEVFDRRKIGPVSGGNSADRVSFRKGRGKAVGKSKKSANEKSVETTRKRLTDRGDLERKNPIVWRSMFSFWPMRRQRRRRGKGDDLPSETDSL